MYVCMYIDIYIYKYMYICILIYIYVYIYIFIHIHICMYIYIHSTRYCSRSSRKLSKSSSRRGLLRYCSTQSFIFNHMYT